MFLTYAKRIWAPTQVNPLEHGQEGLAGSWETIANLTLFHSGDSGQRIICTGQ